MEISLNNAPVDNLEKINLISEDLIRESYLSGRCPTAMWITGLDDGMD